MSTTGVISNQAKLDTFNAGLLTHNDTFGVHLSSQSFSSTGLNTLADFVEVSYAGYASGVWNPTPVAIDGSNHAVGVPGSVSFAGPSAGSVTINMCYVTYTGPGGITTLLESFIIPGSPVVLGSPSTTLTVNLALSDFDFNH